MNQTDWVKLLANYAKNKAIFGHSQTCNNV